MAVSLHIFVNVICSSSYSSLYFQFFALLLSLSTV